MKTNLKLKIGFYDIGQSCRTAYMYVVRDRHLGYHGIDTTWPISWLNLVRQRSEFSRGCLDTVWSEAILQNCQRVLCVCVCVCVCVSFWCIVYFFVVKCKVQIITSLRSIFQWAYFSSVQSTTERKRKKTEKKKTRQGEQRRQEEKRQDRENKETRKEGDKTLRTKKTEEKKKRQGEQKKTGRKNSR